jgi:hypothetical protein
MNLTGLLYHSYYMEMLFGYCTYIVYTDGSLVTDSPGCAFVYDDSVFKFEKHSMAGVDTVEIYAVYWTLCHLLRRQFLVCTNTLNAVQILLNYNYDHPVGQQIQSQVGPLDTLPIRIPHCPLRGARLCGSAW